jgi:hypothetical protein
MRCHINMLSKKKRTRTATKTSTEASERGSTTSFLDLPEEILLELAKIIDPRICSNPSSRHVREPDYPDEAYYHCQPDLTLSRLTLVCKRLHRIYAPFSTWRSLYIGAMDLRSAQIVGQQLEPSPSLKRVLKYSETGIYAREVVIEYKGFYTEGFVEAFARGNLVDFDRFLANTPRLDTVRCINGHVTHKYFVRLPIQFFTSLSSLASLRYLQLGEFDMGSLSSIPPLHQVRIFRYTSGLKPAIFRNLLRFSVPNIDTLYIDDNGLLEGRAIPYALDAISVRCHFPHSQSPPPLLSLLQDSFGIIQSNATTLRQKLLWLSFLTPLDSWDLPRLIDSLRGGKLR